MHDVEAVIVLGDLAEGKLDPGGPDRAREAFQEILNRGIDLRFIVGNHDNGTPDLWSVIDESDDRRIDGRVVEVGDLRIAGLGGVIRGKVWSGDAVPKYHSEAEFVAQTPPQERHKGGRPWRHLTTIMPWTVEELRAQKADVLITHEAPSNHQHGWEFIDDLAADMGARLIVHGHHHRSYSDVLESGIRVRGVGLARVWELEI
ncbi:metallophosphoesterase [Roseivivax sp. GX 12232]|nr:metallophosphoesterase [Roseivivax sp. GX 12232]